MRIATTALTAVIGATGLALAPTATAATPATGDTGGTGGTVAFLADRLEADGDRIKVTSEGQTFDDIGLTIDTVVGMTAAGSGGDASSAATDYVVEHADSYDGAGKDVYAGATAKLLTLASARGLDPRDVGGTNLVAQQRSLEQPNGQFADSSEQGDYSNTIGQSLGIIGLERAGVDPSAESVDYLLAQQCDAGGFSLKYESGCTANPDATSLAVQALSAVGGHEEARSEAADYLVDEQAKNGGLGGGTSTEGVNSNSTGQAAVAFGLTGRDQAREDALGYLESVTFGCDTPKLAGAVAYDKKTYEATTAKGADAEPTGQTTRATAPALLGLSGESWVSVSADGQQAEAPAVDCSEDAGSGDAGSGDTGSGDEGSGDGDSASAAAGTSDSDQASEDSFTGGELALAGVVVLAVVGAVGGLLVTRRRRGQDA